MWEEANLVQWLWEENHVPKVVSSNPGTAYWMAISSFLFVVKIVICVWKDENKLKRGRGWPKRKNDNVDLAPNLRETVFQQIVPLYGEALSDFEINDQQSTQALGQVSLMSPLVCSFDYARSNFALISLHDVCYIVVVAVTVINALYAGTFFTYTGYLKRLTDVGR